jgi:hypothetical protein
LWANVVAALKTADIAPNTKAEQAWRGQPANTNGCHTSKAAPEQPLGAMLRTKGRCMTATFPPNAAPKTRRVIGRPFQKGQSGNPAGKKKGTLNKSTVEARKLAQKFLNEAVEPVFQKLVEMAKAGDIQTIKLVVERILPVMKTFEEPKKIPHQIEVTLKTPAWLQLENKLEGVKTIDANALFKGIVS